MGEARARSPHPPPPPRPLAVTFAEIEAAARRIASGVGRTPFLKSRTLSAIAGVELWLKFENLHFTASFKERGALNRLLLLSAAERARGVIAMSAGNHAQGLAYHAARLGIRATIVMPAATAFVKTENTRRLGAEVVLHGDSVEAAAAHARLLGDRTGAVFIHPFDDPAIIAGQGTVAIEMLEETPLDAIIVPIGGGGLASGVAIAAGALAPATAVIGVEAALYPSVDCLLQGRTPAAGGPTIADGIAVKAPGELTLPILREHLRELLLVTEAEIEAAVLQLVEIEKTVVEGAGATPLAAAMQARDRLRGQRVGIILSGGNIDMRLLSGVILRGLVRSHRLVRLRVGLPDLPGSLAQLAGAIAAAGGNVVDVVHQRAFSRLGIKEADVDFTVETRDGDHALELLQALRAAGFNAAELEPGM